jgi:hypothetical protein
MQVDCRHNKPLREKSLPLPFNAPTRKAGKFVNFFLSVFFNPQRCALSSYIHKECVTIKKSASYAGESLTYGDSYRTFCKDR